jgi:hypothetical protein
VPPLPSVPCLYSPVPREFLSSSLAACGMSDVGSLASYEGFQFLSGETGVVLQMMGASEKGNSARYMFLNSIGNVAVIYMTWTAGLIVGHVGTRSLGAFDGHANILTALIFIF